MHKYLPLYLILFVLFQTGCTGNYGHILTQADAIMEDNPDSAMNILYEINSNQLRKSELPYYALLLTQAQVKTNIRVDSDSLISLSFHRYADTWRGDKGIRSWFYMGEVFFNQEKPRKAMRHYLTAYEESKRLHNYYWRAKSAERIADLFFNAYNYDEAAKYRTEAINFYGKSNRIINQRYSIVDLASDYINSSRYEMAIHILDSLYNRIIRDKEENPHLIQYLKRGRANALAFLGRLEELDKEDLKFLNQAKSKKSKIDSCIFMIRFQDHGIPNKISTLMDMLKEDSLTVEDKALAYYACYEYLKSLNNMSGLREIIDSLVYYQNAVAEGIIQASVTASERDFYTDMARNNQRKFKIYLMFTYVFIILTSLCIIILWKFFRLKIIAQRADLQSKVEDLLNIREYSATMAAELSALHIELSNKNECLERRSAVLNSLFKEKWHTLNTLCEEYFEKESSPKAKDLINKRIESEVKNIGSDEGLQLIEEEVNRYMDGIIALLRKECPDIKEKDIALCSLFFSGFSVKAICFILQMQSNNLYVRKTRLIKKLKECAAPHKDLFIERLSR